MQGQAKQALDGQAELNSSIRELRAAPEFAAGSGKPRHGFILKEPHPLTAALHCFQLVVLRSAVARLGLQEQTHHPRLPNSKERFLQQRGVELATAREVAGESLKCRLVDKPLLKRFNFGPRVIRR